MELVWNSTSQLHSKAVGKGLKGYLRGKRFPADAHNYVGVIFLKQGNLQEAASQFTETIRLNPDHAYGHRNLAAVLAREKRFQEAIPLLRKAIQIFPSYAEAHLNLGIVYCEMGRKDLALSEYEILQRIDPARAAVLSQSMK